MRLAVPLRLAVPAALVLATCAVPTAGAQPRPAAAPVPGLPTAPAPAPAPAPAVLGAADSLVPWRPQEPAPAAVAATPAPGDPARRAAAPARRVARAPGARSAPDSLAPIRPSARDRARLDTLRAALQGRPLPRQVILVSIAQRRLFYLQGDSLVAAAPVAIGKNTAPDASEGDAGRRFHTPRGRFVVQRRDSMPLWVPPDWHYVEAARKQKRGLRWLERGDSLVARDGRVLTVVGTRLFERRPGREAVPVVLEPGKELVVDGRIVVPPTGVIERQYPHTLGTRRLYLGDGYGIHGTTDPGSIGQAATHGCIRMRNRQIEALWPLVPTRTPVLII